MSGDTWKHGWKVVDNFYDDFEKRWVFRSTAEWGLGSVRYAKGRITRPNRNCGPLCVFRTRVQAVDYLHSYGSVHDYLARCEYVPSRETKVWAYGTIRTDFPAGTVLADKIRLLTEPNREIIWR